MSEFSQLLRNFRKELQFTQTELATYLNQLDDEFNSVDVVTINRWENRKVKPSTYKAIKILQYLGGDLFETIKSFKSQQKDTLIELFLNESYGSFQSRISALSGLNQQQDERNFKSLPLMSEPCDTGVIDRIKLLSKFTKVDISPLDQIDLYLYYCEKKAHGHKLINTDGDIVSHNVGFFFEDHQFETLKAQELDLRMACSLNSSKSINYFNISSHSETKDHVIEHIVSDIQLLSKNKNIKKYSVLVKDPNMMKLLKGVGFEVFKFSEPSAKKCNITFKNKHYSYCILTIDKIDFLTNRHVMSLIKDEYSTMRAFPLLLREARKKLKLTQKDFAAYINHLDNEFNSVDVVTINRWENSKVKPSNYKALKLLDCLGLDLYTTLKSFDSEDNEDSVLLEDFLRERFFSFQSRISSITKGEIEEGCDCQIMPLMTDQNDKAVIDRIKLISQYTKVDPSALDTIDLFLYCSEKKAHGRKMVDVNGDIVSHSLGFFFNEDVFEQYQNKHLHIKQACSLDSNHNLNYIVVSGHSEKREQSIANLISDMKLIARNTKIKKYSMIIKNPSALELMKNIGFEIWKFSEPTEQKSNITFKNKNYHYCVLTIDKIELLTNKNVIAFINKYG
ncbi:helix-turn-helix domain-containing protein [Vibrio crassostreae]|uniref:helix-turn-helix domain-containing protein n=1 Tax=Vibrio crassostreae TaxID=246167 RepID=UPI00104D3349|nr:helix-turn-helix transcriptional regulator [Vibrio crassostreae]TCO00258.1 helix-turn-helix protein [Vibrio crassostreae]CAK2121186.1 Helix-turn-helix protein [Vibrio crassostreae]CAK2124492.1 Helix-turn-helix protein [Vibrio crassostreae]CAK2134358.1 Helix-turn-helix protein [Vibrio crassostreae]CAK2970217.1 Helix-turn-helix protein [Vibrio crassostreae]